MKNKLFCSEVWPMQVALELAMVLTFPEFAGSMFFISEGTPKPYVGQRYLPFLGRSSPTSYFIAACEAPVMPAQHLLGLGIVSVLYTDLLDY